jgi:hypothetical protein
MTGTLTRFGSSIGSVSRPEIGAAGTQLADEPGRRAGRQLHFDAGMLLAERP